MLDKRVMRDIREDCREHTNMLARKAEDAAGKNNMKDLYDITKQIAGYSFSKTVNKSPDGGSTLRKF